MMASGWWLVARIQRQLSVNLSNFLSGGSNSPQPVNPSHQPPATSPSHAVQDGVFLELSDPPDLHSASPVNVLCTASRQSSAPRNLRRRFQRNNR